MTDFATSCQLLVSLLALFFCVEVSLEFRRIRRQREEDLRTMTAWIVAAADNAAIAECRALANVVQRRLDHDAEESRRALALCQAQLHELGCQIAELADVAVPGPAIRVDSPPFFWDEPKSMGN